MTRKSSEQALHLVFPAHTDRWLLRAVTLVAVLALVFCGPAVLEADVIAAGTDVVDSEIDLSGDTAYLLSAGGSTITIVDTATDEVVGVISTFESSGTCLDIDVRADSSRPIVGTSGGKILEGNPINSTVSTIVFSSGADFRVIAADDWDPMAVAWAAEGSGDDLIRVPTSGPVTTEAALPAGTPLEMKEMPNVTGSLGAEKEKLVVVGTDSPDLWLFTFDRDTDAADDVSLDDLTPTGLATAGPEYAYVSAMDANGDGYLLRAEVSTLAFDSSPIETWTDTAALDVATAGPWINVLLVPDGQTETYVHAFDGGDPANPLSAGSVLINPTLAAAGGFAAAVGDGDTLGDLYFVCGIVDEDAVSARTAELLEYFDFEDVSGSISFACGMTTSKLNMPLCVVGADPCNPPPSAATGGHVDPAPRCGTGRDVKFATGEEILVVPVLHVPGVGLDFSIDLTYRSRRDFDYRYGKGWFLNQDVRLEALTGGDQRYHDGYGRLEDFNDAGGGTFVAPPLYDSVLTLGSPSTITNRFGVVTTFDSSGRRTSVEDRFGNEIQYTWTGDQLTQITDTLGHTYALSYGSDGRLSSLTDHVSRTWTLAYDYLGRLVEVVTPATTAFTTGRATRFSYAPNHTDSRFPANLVHVWNPDGQRAQSLWYDEDDLVYLERIGAAEWSMQYVADSSGVTTTVEDRSGDTSVWTFNPSGLVTDLKVYTKGLRSGEPAYFQTTYEVASTGLIEAVVHPRGNRTEYTYDSDFDLLEVRHKTTNTTSDSSDDIVHTWEYGAYSQPTEYTDPRGNVTTFTLDSLGRTTEIARPTVTSPATQTITEEFDYDSRGRITAARDGEGREVALEYFTTGAQTGWLKAVVNDPAGLELRTEFTYNDFGVVTSITDPRGAVTTITVDAEGYPTEIQAPSPLSFRRRFAYDLARRVTQVEVENLDAEGTADPTTPWIATNLTYDAVGRLIEKEVALTASTTATTTYEYEGSGRVAKLTRPAGDETTFTWDERGLLFQMTRGVGTAAEATVRWDYDANGNLAAHVNGRGKTTTYASDLFDRLSQVTDALGAYTTLEYDKSGNRTEIEAYDDEDALVAKTVHHFDEVDRLWKIVQHRFGQDLTTTYPQTIITRDRGHRFIAVEDPGNNVTTWGYDAAGRLVDLADAVGNAVSFTLDDNGNVTRVEESEVPDVGSAQVFATEFDYDAVNRVVEKREIDRTNSSNVLTTTYHYDSRSNLTFRVDAENHPVRWVYDLASRLVSYERALSVGSTIDDFVTQITETFEYDANDRLVKLVDDNFSETAYDYDALDRSTRTTYEDTKFVDRSFDDQGNVVGWEDQNGTEVENTYDDLDRLVSREVTRGTGVQGTTAETYSYDALGRLLTAVDDDYQVERTWDSLGNLLKERQGYTASGNERWKTVTSTYGAAGARTSITYPSAFALTLVRDDIYRMTALHDATNTVDVATFAWQGASRLAATTNQNGTVTEYAWDGFRRLATIDHQLSGGGSLHKMEYLYDKVHNRRMEKNSFDATWMGGLPSAVQTFLGGRDAKGDVYAYDWAYRMVDARYDVANPASEVATPGSQSYGKLVQYTLDGLGNRSQVATTPPTPASTVTYAFDVMNQYTTIGGVSRTHDDNGNVTDDGTMLWVYDYRNLVVEVKDKGTSATIATYRYDAVGRRVEKAVNGGATTRYLLDGVQVIEEYDGSNAWQARYLYEDGIDRPRAMDRADIADVDGDTNTTEVLRFHYHQQALGSVTELTAPSGAVVEWVTYDVYGLPTIRDQAGSTISASAVGNPWLFTGREWDVESGTYYYRARTYDSGAGRFLQRDPAGYVDGCSQYEYVTSSPSASGDASGLSKDPRNRPRQWLEESAAAYLAAQAVLDAAWGRYDQALEAALNASIAVQNLLAAIAALQARIQEMQATVGECESVDTSDLDAQLEDLLAQLANARLRQEAAWAWLDDAVSEVDAAWDAAEAAATEFVDALVWNAHLRGGSVEAWAFIRAYAWEHKSCIACHNFLGPMPGPWSVFGVTLGSFAMPGPGGAAPRLSSNAIGAIGQRQLMRMVGGRAQVHFATPLGGRIADAVAKGILYEAKVGAVSLRSKVAAQLAKDAWLMANGHVRGATWVFFRSPVTGLGGPSGPLAQELRRVGINILLR